MIKWLCCCFFCFSSLMACDCEPEEYPEIPKGMNGPLGPME